MDYGVLVRSAPANHEVPVFNLAGVNVVDLFVAVILTDPFRRAVVYTGPLCTPARLTKRQRRLLLTASLNPTFHARLLRFGRILLREYRRCQREDKYRREQQSELLLQHFFSPYSPGSPGRSDA